jgi:hypothetical protein
VFTLTDYLNSLFTILADRIPIIVKRFAVALGDVRHSIVKGERADALKDAAMPATL